MYVTANALMCCDAEVPNGVRCYLFCLLQRGNFTAQGRCFVAVAAVVIVVVVAVVVVAVVVIVVVGVAAVVVVIVVVVVVIAVVL